MKKFKFKLQRLLEMREASEKEAKNELARVLIIQNREKVKQEDLRHGIDTHSVRFREKMAAGRFTASEAMLFEKFVSRSFRAIELAGDKIAQMEPQVSARRARVIEASRERKIVEKLKERKLNVFNYEFNREIAKENDDANQKIYLKRSREGAE